MATDAVCIVLDGNQRAALAMVRALGNAGNRVIVADERHPCLAGTSRFCSEKVTYPSPTKAPAEFMDWVRATAHAHSEAVFLPQSDVTVPLCLAVREAGTNIRLPFPCLAAYESLSDKLELSHRCGYLGIDTPATYLAEHVRDAARQRSWPAVVKPRWSVQRTTSDALRLRVTYAHDENELARTLATMLERGASAALVQEYVAGEGRGAFGCYVDGTRVASFSHRRVREKPPSGGVSVVSESCPPDEQMLASLDRLVAPLRWTGLAMGEFKYTTTGRRVLIEVNARPWGSIQLAIDCGVDFPSMLAEIGRLGRTYGPVTYRTGWRLRWYLGDLDHSLLTLRNGAARSLRARAFALAKPFIFWTPRSSVETFRASDPMPFFEEVRQYIRNDR
jgi:predicted ATP-grasp superfamily ATP-dependent carboligase